MDFGLAKREAGEITMTVEGQVLGTPAYMSPEQARGEGHRVDARGDVYSLGVVFYQVLTGELPFRGTQRMLLHQVMYDEPRAPRTLNDRIPKDLETITLKAMAKEPARRYAGAGEFAADLRRFLKGEPIAARPVGRWEKAVRWCRRKPAVAGLTAAVALLLVAGTAVATLFALNTSRTNVDLIEARNAIDEERGRAVGQRDLARRNLYVSHMLLAQQAWHAGNIGWLLELLHRQEPAEDRPDLRAWEWYYLESLCHKDLLTLSGHQGHVQAVAWSPDGKQLASGGQDRTVRIWDKGTGRTVHLLQGHQAPLRAVVWSGDGRRLASASEDGVLRIWDAKTGKEERVLKGHRRAVVALAWSTDGKRLASGASDGQVKIWSADDGTQLHTLSAEDVVRGIAWLEKDGQLVGLTDKTLLFWDAQTGKELRKQALGKGSFTSLAVHPSGQLAATANGSGDLAIWKLSDGERLFAMDHAHTPRAECIAWSPNGQWLASSGLDAVVHIWSAKDAGKVNTLRGHTKSVYAVAWSPDSKHLASAGGEGAVKIYAAMAQEGTALHSEIPATAIYETAWWSPDGRKLVSGGWWLAEEPAVVWDWEPATGRGRVKVGPSTEKASATAWSPDGRRLALAVENIVSLCDAETLDEVQTLHGSEKGLNIVAWSPDGRRVSAGGRDGMIRVWDAASGELVATLQGHGSPVIALAWNRDGTRLASASSVSPIFLKVWEVESGKALHSLADPGQSTIFWVSWSPDGRLIASADGDSTVKIWDAATGEKVSTLRGHTGPVTCVAWHPDARPGRQRLASTGFDQSVRVWDFLTGQEVLTLRTPSLFARTVAWSPDGRCLAGAWGKGITIWDAGAGSVVRSGYD